MKEIKISLFIFTVFLAVLIVSSGFVCAITSDEVYVKGIVLKQQFSVGERVPVAVFFHNNSTETVTLDYIGVHFSWMPSETLYGYNLSSTPVTVGAGKDYFFPQYINVTVPAGTGGSQSFYVGVDGTDSSSNPFSFNSNTVELIISGGGPTATPTNNGNGSANGSNGLPSIFLYGIIVAVIAVVAVLLVVVLMRRGQKPSKPTAQPSEKQPTPSKPEEEKTGTGQDFSI